MNCQDFERVVVDLSRLSAENLEAIAHAESCPSCAARFAEERALTERMTALRRAMEVQEAPAALEQRLVAAFRQRPGSHTRRWRVWVPVAAAAALVLALALPRRPKEDPVTPPQAPVVTVIEDRVEAAPSPRPKPRSRVAPPRKREPPREVATDFLPLPDAEELMPQESRQVVRIRLPRAAMESFGLPVSEYRVAERISADVVLGEDGVARAIRFINVVK